jgi:hypothetical protein
LPFRTHHTSLTQPPLQHIASNTPNPVAADFQPVKFNQIERPYPSKTASQAKQTQPKAPMFADRTMLRTAAKARGIGGEGFAQRQVTSS